MDSSLTVLCARPQQIDDVFVPANHLHHFHFRHQVGQIFLSGVVWEG